MKLPKIFVGLALALSFVLLPSSFVRAATTINSVNKFAYGANIGWMDWRGDTNNGAVIGEYVCSGFIYAANVGWINLGSGAPTNGIQYQNVSSNDFGVNHDGLGNLRGYAYGANIGWINFEVNGAAKVDLSNGRFTGSIYSANCGWISLSNAFAYVQTDSIRMGADTDGDGITDGWERLHFGNLSTANASSDSDSDGQTDLAEYIADTDPLNGADLLRITSNSVLFFGAAQDSDTLIWQSRPTRQYRVQQRTNLNSGFSWIDTGFLFNASPGNMTTQTINFVTSSSERYFRIQALKPLP